MSKATIKDHDQIIEAINKYVDGVTSGKSEVMKPAFHKDAIMYGFEVDGLVEGSIQNLYDFVDQAGSAQNLQARIDILDVEGTVASARIALENAHGATYTDFHQLLKIDGEWKVISKLFHRHS
ncbi:nuclear transport factor 2 family protein [Ectobacillus panaciterrae]|uniref:nuclear transport factor 2 family protein n=1 Tax=Ectobacillus panaciterrae TaxID=363872 RepID=UPI0004205F15|nr:nuclear transport factor 2 family protein [Ectobacillus panaciterrae]